MKPVLKFTPIELSIYERGETFWYFSKAAPTGYSVTVDIDVTHMLAVLKAAKKSFSPLIFGLQQKFFANKKNFALPCRAKFLGFTIRLPQCMRFFMRTIKHSPFCGRNLTITFPNFIPHICRTKPPLEIATVFLQKRASSPAKCLYDFLRALDKL